MHTQAHTRLIIQLSYSLRSVEMLFPANMIETITKGDADEKLMVILIPKEAGMNATNSSFICEPTKEYFEKALGGTVTGRCLATNGAVDGDERPVSLDSNVTYLTGKSSNLKLEGDVFGKAAIMVYIVFAKQPLRTCGRSWNAYTLPLRISIGESSLVTNQPRHVT